MDTLRGFVEAVWTTDKEVQHKHAVPGVWSKPDSISDSFELRRLTTSKNRSDSRTDFFELYWAHLMEGTSVHHVLAWARLLLLRWPWTVPPQLLGVWIFLVVVGLVAGLFFIHSLLPETMRVVEIDSWITGLLGAFSVWVAGPIVKSVIGDAARYLNPAPTNVQRRQTIRSHGVKILERLHEQGYERIIVVGHSLGSVIGYDILTHSWARFGRETKKGEDNNKAHPVMDELEESLSKEPFNLDRYRQGQRAALDELAENGMKWRVTDFLTLGSPLAHAQILLAADKDDLGEKKEAREFPTSPPVLEDKRFSYPPRNARRRPHHAAVFGFTRWTNLYFPARWIVFGDLIGGPVANVFGRGVKDVAVKTRQYLGLFSHTLYWNAKKCAPPCDHIQALREALDLLDARPNGPTE